MSPVRDADGKVIRSVEYVGRDDVWRAMSIHQMRPQTFHDEDRARQWIRQLHAEGASQAS